MCCMKGFYTEYNCQVNFKHRCCTVGHWKDAVFCAFFIFKSVLISIKEDQINHELAILRKVFLFFKELIFLLLDTKNT